MVQNENFNFHVPQSGEGLGNKHSSKKRLLSKQAALLFGVCFFFLVWGLLGQT